MTHQQAVAVVAAPLPTVEGRLRDVCSWPDFMLGVESVTETSFSRYRFAVSDGRKTREIPVAVTAHPREHRIVWHALSGPRFDGELRLTAVDADRTRVSLSLTADPAGFLASLADFLHTEKVTAELDLQRLERLVTGSST